MNERERKLQEALEVIAKGELAVDCAAQEYAKNVPTRSNGRGGAGC